MTDSCYACLQAATTREHVPPACLFPEKKDVQDRANLRRNLITVPSCAGHNLVKSGDDEYFLWVLTTNVPGNSVAQMQVRTKLARSYTRRPALGDSLLDSGKDVTVVGSQNGMAFDAIEVPLSGERFQNILDLIARGLFRHHFGEPWRGAVRVHPDFIGFPNVDATIIDTSRIFLYECANKIFANEPKHGENPTVFWYQVHQPEARLRCLMRFAFYEGCTATAFFGMNSY
jgi:hypothetical protein